jgi:flagellum-specific peptidoglycan hydrolase FlgJ
MKELVLLFLKKNWFKMGIALFLCVVAFQDELSFNINLKNPSQRPTRQEVPDDPIHTQEILSSGAISSEDKKTTNRFNLQPFTPSWRKNKSKGDRKKPDKSAAPRVRALAKLASIDPEELDNFIRRFAHVAISEQEKYGIPASITIANSLLMSTANHAVLAQDHLNFFRLPCTSDWEGRQTYFEGNCYRAYKTAWLSFRDHSNYLKQLRDEQKATLAPDDYKAWAKFLQQQDFAGEPEIEQQLIQLIEDMELFYLDQN